MIVSAEYLKKKTIELYSLYDEIEKACLGVNDGTHLSLFEERQDDIPKFIAECTDKTEAEIEEKCEVWKAELKRKYADVIDLQNVEEKDRVKVLCYVTEQVDSQGNSTLLLKDKETDKTVILTGKQLRKDHFKQFMEMSKISYEVMPTIFDSAGTDVAIIIGYIEAESETELTVNIDIAGGGYFYDELEEI